MARRPPARSVTPESAVAPPKGLFAVTLSRGPAWDGSLPMEQQPEWSAHAEFMDTMERDGFVFIGGPLEDTPYVLLAVRADTAMEVRTKLQVDPWQASRLLEITRIAAWSLRLGAAKV